MIDQKHAFTQLYEETYDDILKYIITHCSNIEDANEILQDTYLDFYRALSKDKTIIAANRPAIICKKYSIMIWYYTISTLKLQVRYV